MMTHPSPDPSPHPRPPRPLMIIILVLVLGFQTGQSVDEIKGILAAVVAALAVLAAVGMLHRAHPE
ncbi:hypothetical protein [Herbidospora daliensis]|uniref:hypothetical protein n=1 Tax=Herbidospora daliensis TaxID=295585 RepID=UPI000A72EAD6|nr:hypothetical protein [Herbidospora daliensis]